MSAIHYDSLSKAAEDFGCSRQWLSKLIERGDLVAHDIPGEQQRKRVWHQHVAEALAKNGGLRPHSCVCYDFAHLQGIEEGRQESTTALLEELAQVKADRDKAQESATALLEELGQAQSPG